MKYALLAFVFVSAFAWAFEPPVKLCEGEFALCAASTCTETGNQITITKMDGTQATYPELSCTCPVLNGKAIASPGTGNMPANSCVAPKGGVWSLYSFKQVFPQEANGFSPKKQDQKVKGQVCDASLNLGDQLSNCYSMACTDAKPINGQKMATCLCPMGEAPSGDPIAPATSFITDAGQGNTAACAQHPVGGPIP